MEAIQTPKKHHTVQEAYLRSFVSPELRSQKMHKYSKARKQWGRPVSPRAATVVENYYSAEMPDGSLNSSFEIALNKEIETPGIEPLRKLAAGKCLSDIERQHLSAYLGVALVRTTRIDRTLQRLNRRIVQPAVVEAYIKARLPGWRHRITDSQADAFIKEVYERGYGVTLPQGWHLGSVARGVEYGKIIHAMNWRVETAGRGSYFLTSDNPAFTWIPNRPRLPFIVGIDRDDLRVHFGFPLSPTAFLVASKMPLSPPRIRCTRSRVRELNRQIAINASEFVFSPYRTDEMDLLIEMEANSTVEVFDAEAVLNEICQL